MIWVLIYGRRTREKHLGYVADYCPICRKVGSFDVLERRMANHIWFIPLERGDFLGTTKICNGCATESLCHIGQYKGPKHSNRGSLESLIEATYPTVREANKESLALAEALATGVDGIDAKVRLQLMKEAFSMAEAHFRDGYGHQGRRILELTLRPLLPTEAEVRACLQPYRGSYGSRMGAILRIEEVMVLIYPESEVKDPNRFSY